MRRFNVLTALLAACLGLGTAARAPADVFYPIDSVSVFYPDGGGPFYPERNLYQGAGIGFDAMEPHDQLPGGTWVTQACGAACDYIEVFGEPVISLDLGQDRSLTEISVWGYATSNSNGLQEFSLRFASNADGPNGFGTSISYNPLIEDVDIDDLIRQSFPFGQDINARYVEMTVTKNWFDSGIPGGDRVGIGEIAFQAPDDFVPPPPPAPSVEFYPIESIESSTRDFDFYQAEGLIQGPGVGFLNSDPFDRLSGGAEGLWVTEACGFPCDYLDTFDPPELYLDLGEDVPLSEINLWGYSDTNSNGVLEFSLSFATDADGPDGYGTSVSYEPTFSDVEIDSIPRQIFPFDQTVTARYVRLTALDNYFEEPGTGGGENGWPPGGDRVGLGEIAFPIPSSSIPGDFNGDGVLDLVDINALNVEVAGGMNPLPYDVTGDSLVNEDDIKFWVEDLKNSWVGDANLDGAFDSTDFVEIFQAGKFETGNPAKWEEGDWTGDLLFDSSDLVSAFQGGGFELGPRQAVSAVPEPGTSVLLLLGGLVGLIRTRRRLA